MFGTINLTYTPPDNAPEERNVSMSFSSEVNLDDILVHFEHFIKALGYPLNFLDSITISRQDNTKFDVETPWDFNIGAGFYNMNYTVQSYGGYNGQL